MKQVFAIDDIHRMMRRVTFEIIEKNPKLDDLILFGIVKKGVPIANMIRDNLARHENFSVPIVPLDISSYRDDAKRQSVVLPPVDVTGKVCILVDDVLFTGRTIRAAMDALIDMGRPAKIQFAVLIDRGHRELPIRADYVGKNLPTSRDERIYVDVTSDQPGIYIDRSEG
jgi:pyrimidine operon attenuation protein / uracil phosphoribosyltransferase